MIEFHSFSVFVKQNLCKLELLYFIRCLAGENEYIEPQ